MVLQHELCVVAEATCGHLGIRPCLELDVAVIALAPLAELEHAVDASLEGLDLDGPGTAHGRTRVSGEREQILRVREEQQLERPVGLHCAFRRG